MTAVLPPLQNQNIEISLDQNTEEGYYVGIATTTTDNIASYFLQPSSVSAKTKEDHMDKQQKSLNYRHEYYLPGMQRNERPIHNSDSNLNEKLVPGRDKNGRVFKRMKLPFPLKLHYMLEDLESNGSSKIVSWVASGTAFKVHDQAAFEETVMTKYFRQTKFTSFIRQLYLYNFAKIETQDDESNGAYFHPKFRKDEKSLSFEITRSPREDRRKKKFQQQKKNHRSVADYEMFASSKAHQKRPETSQYFRAIFEDESGASSEEESSEGGAVTPTSIPSISQLSSARASFDDRLRSALYTRPPSRNFFQNTAPAFATIDGKGSKVREDWLNVIERHIPSISDHRLRLGHGPARTNKDLMLTLEPRSIEEILSEPDRMQFRQSEY